MKSRVTSKEGAAESENKVQPAKKSLEEQQHQAVTEYEKQSRTERVGQTSTTSSPQQPQQAPE